MQETRTSLDTSDLMHNMSLGQFINVEILNIHKDRFNTTLIGMKPQKFLLLELPSIVKRGELLERMVMNNNLIIRSICEFTTGECLAFETTTDAVVRSPHPMFYVNFPLKIAYHELRKENRKHLFMPAMFKNLANGTESKGTIVDISSGGCKLEVDNELLLQDADNTPMQISYVSPETAAPVTRAVRLCSRRKKGQHGAFVGLAFIEEESPAP